MATALSILSDASAASEKRTEVFNAFYGNYCAQSIEETNKDLKKKGIQNDCIAEDITQDAWVILYDKVLKGELIANAPGLLCGIVENLISNYWRKETRQNAIFSPLFDENYINNLFQDETNDNEAYSNLLYKIGLLPKKCRKMFNYLIDGFSIPEMYDELIKERQINAPEDINDHENIAKWRNTMYVQASDCRKNLSNLLDAD